MEQGTVEPTVLYTPRGHLPGITRWGVSRGEPQGFPVLATRPITSRDDAGEISRTLDTPSRVILNFHPNIPIVSVRVGGFTRLERIRLTTPSARGLRGATFPIERPLRIAAFTIRHGHYHLIPITGMLDSCLVHPRKAPRHLPCSSVEIDRHATTPRGNRQFIRAAGGQEWSQTMPRQAESSRYFPIDVALGCQSRPLVWMSVEYRRQLLGLVPFTNQ